jgi:adenylylsulfate kinase-like enzyme/SAM-dependent methyltransferase
LSGAGKTTIGNRLYYELRKERDNVILLDGDLLKKILADDLGYTESDRKKRAIKYNMLCKALTDQRMTVICCTIAMYDEVREWNRKNNKGYVEIFLDVSLEVLKRRDQKGMYSQAERGMLKNVLGMDMQAEFPKNPDIVLKNDGRHTVKECVDKILDYKVLRSSDYDRDTSYWNAYYESKPNIEQSSLFAVAIGSQLKKSCTILDLGCGNGRDSLYFYKLGLNVTAIDSSDLIIRGLQEQYNKGNLCFICDDFVCSSMIYAGQYDYCYSRFSLHAINEEQEDEVIANVYKVLKEGGKFFLEVRSVNDDLYGKGKKVGNNSYFYDGHFRRFLKCDELENKMLAVGFKIEYSKEQRGFSPFGKDDPPIIRMILKK